MTGRTASVVFLTCSIALWSRCFWTVRSEWVGVVQDDGYYLQSAQALRHGQGYVLPGRPGPPGRPKYPIGFPATLAAAFAISGRSGPSTAYGVVLLSGWVLAAAAYVWVRRLGRSAPQAALVAAGAAFASLPRIVYVMADLPLCAVGAVLFARWAKRGASKAAGFIDGALIGFAFLLRRPGIALLPAGLLARRSEGSMTALLAGFLVVDLPFEWYARRFPVTVNEGYLAEAIGAGWGGIGAVAGVILRNVKQLLITVPQNAMPVVYTNVVRTHVPAIAVALATAGLWALLLRGGRRLIRKNAAVVPVGVFSLVTVAIIAVWPWDVGQRLAMPLAPVTLLALGAGVEGGRRWLWSGALVWAIAFSADAAIAARASMPSNRDVTARDNLACVLEFIRTQTEPDAIIATEAPEMVYGYTARQGIQLIEGADEFDPRPAADPLKHWLPAVGQRPLYLLGTCVEPPDYVRVKAEQVLASPRFRPREVFRTPDCQYRIDALRPSSGR